MVPNAELPLSGSYYGVDERIELWGLQIPHNSARPQLEEVDPADAEKAAEKAAAAEAKGGGGTGRKRKAGGGGEVDFIRARGWKEGRGTR